MLDFDLSHLDAELLLDLRVIDIGRQKLPTRQRLPHMRERPPLPVPGSHVQQIKAAAELQGKPQGMCESLSARFGEIGRVSDGYERVLAHRNLLPRFRWIGDALERDCESIYAWRIAVCNQGFPFVNS
jgi:hypothetical protein